LRFTKASQFRMSTHRERLGGIPDYLIVWSMMFDEDGNGPVFPDGHPKAGQAMTPDWLGFNLTPQDTPRLLAALSEATTGAVLEKKIVVAMEKLATEESEKLSGLIAGLSRDLPSDSPEALQAPVSSSESSGGSPQENSTPSANDTSKESESLTFAPV